MTGNKCEVSYEGFRALKTFILHPWRNMPVLKEHSCRFENFAIGSGSYKNNTLKISHSSC